MALTLPRVGGQEDSHASVFTRQMRQEPDPWRGESRKKLSKHCSGTARTCSDEGPSPAIGSPARQGGAPGAQPHDGSRDQNRAEDDRSSSKTRPLQLPCASAFCLRHNCPRHRASMCWEGEIKKSISSNIKLVASIQL